MALKQIAIAVLLFGALMGAALASRVPAAAQNRVDQPAGAAGPLFYGSSRYMSTTDPAALKRMGCQQGKATPDGAVALVILDFGQPWYSADTGQFGTLIFTSHTFRATGDIEAAAETYLNAFYLCSPERAYLRLVVGTSNFGRGVSRTHGAAWAQMINAITAWLNAPPSIASKVSVRGGSDMEPDFGSAAGTRAWVDGYTGAYTGSAYLYNYGACSGCAYQRCPTCQPINGWTTEDVWYVSYGAAPAWPVPEIYLTNGIHADQWYRISLYGYLKHAGAIEFKGALTQWQACQTHGPCRSLDNKPDAGFNQLFDALNADPRTTQAPGWASDIGYEN